MTDLLLSSSSPGQNPSKVIKALDLWSIAKKHNTVCKSQANAKQILNALKTNLATKISFDFDTQRGNKLLNKDLFLEDWDSRIRERILSPHTIVKNYTIKWSMETTINRCIRGLIKKHPILCELASILHQSNTLDTYWNDTLKETILDTLHVMHIYEALVRYADGNKKMVTSLIDFYSFEKWESYKSSWELLTKTHPFTFIKAESVNWCLMQYISMSDVIEDNTLEHATKTKMLSKMGEMVTFGLKYA